MIEICRFNEKPYSSFKLIKVIVMLHKTYVINLLLCTPRCTLYIGLCIGHSSVG